MSKNNLDKINSIIQERINYYMDEGLVYSDEEFRRLDEQGMLGVYAGNDIKKILNIIYKDKNHLENQELLHCCMKETKGCANPQMVIKEINLKNQLLKE